MVFYRSFKHDRFLFLFEQRLKMNLYGISQCVDVVASFEQADDALELVTTGLGVPRSPRALYGFGNPTPFCSGPAPVSTRVATVSFWNLGGLQIWTGFATLRPKRFRLPGRLVEPRPRLRFGKLRTVDGRPDPTSAEVDYGDLDLPALLAALEPQAKR